MFKNKTFLSLTRSVRERKGSFVISNNTTLLSPYPFFAFIQNPISVPLLAPHRLAVRRRLRTCVGVPDDSEHSLTRFAHERLCQDLFQQQSVIFSVQHLLRKRTENLKTKNIHFTYLHNVSLILLQHIHQQIIPYLLHALHAMFPHPPYFGKPRPRHVLFDHVQSTCNYICPK